MQAIAEIVGPSTVSLITGLFGTLVGLGFGVFLWKLNRKASRLDTLSKYMGDLIGELFYCLDARHQFSTWLIQKDGEQAARKLTPEQYQEKRRQYEEKHPAERRQVANLRVALCRVRLHCKNKELSEYATIVAEIVEHHPYPPPERTQWMYDNLTQFTIKNTYIEEVMDHTVQTRAGLMYYTIRNLIDDLANKFVEYTEQMEPMKVLEEN